MHCYHVWISRDLVRRGERSWYRYRVISVFRYRKDQRLVFTAPTLLGPVLVMPSVIQYKKGDFVNPTKILKQFLQEKRNAAESTGA